MSLYDGLLNSSPYVKNLSKLKAFANNNINVTEKIKCALGRVDNIVGKEKGENADNQHFLLLPRCFHVSSSSRSLKVGFAWLSVNPLQTIASFQ